MAYASIVYIYALFMFILTGFFSQFLLIIEFFKSIWIMIKTIFEFIKNIIYFILNIIGFFIGLADNGNEELF